MAFTPEEEARLKKLEDAHAAHEKAVKPILDEWPQVGNMKNDLEAVTKKLSGEPPNGPESKPPIPPKGEDKCACGCGGKTGAHVRRIFPFPGWYPA